MRIVLGADHGGLELKDFIAGKLETAGYTVLDIGTDSSESVDYPDYAIKAAEMVASGEVDRGILVLAVESRPKETEGLVAADGPAGVQLRQQYGRLSRDQRQHGRRWRRLPGRFLPPCVGSRQVAIPCSVFKEYPIFEPLFPIGVMP